MTASAAGVVDTAVALGRWRRSTPRGTVAQASFDEDAVTLAARAGLAVLHRNPDVRPTLLIVATLSAPLLEPGVAPYLTEVFDVQAAEGRRGCEVLELGGSVSAGLAAVSAAATKVAIGMGPALVVATDDRRDAKGRPLGAGAVALLLDEDGEVGRVAAAGVSSELFLDRWQRRDDPGVQTGDRSLDRFSPGRAFADGLDGVRTLYSHAAGPTIDRVGYPGTAAPLISMLAADLAKDDTVLAVASAGGITHAIELTAGPGFDAAAERVHAEVQGGIDGDPPTPPDESEFDPYISHSAAYRERGQTYRLEGAKDTVSGEIYFPPPPAASSEGLEEFRLARSGTVVTFGRDHVFPVGAPLTMAVVDLDGGGRFYGQVVDGLEVDIGDRVALVLRRLHEAGGVPNYFWKIQPNQEGAS